MDAIAFSLMKTARLAEETVWELSINPKKTGTTHPPTKRFLEKMNEISIQKKTMRTTIRTIFGIGFLILTLSFVVPSKAVKKINSTESNINWLAKKITGQHTGTLKFKEGILEFVDDQLVGGFFMVDMNSLAVTDLKGFFKKKLEKHLKSDDFFETELHKTARMKITSTSGEKDLYEVTADFTIRGLTKSVVFKMNVQDSTATATVALDRTNFGIHYKSSSFFDNLKNKAIDDIFELEVSLKF